MLPATIVCVVELSSSNIKPVADTEVLISFIAPTIDVAVVAKLDGSPISVEDNY